MNTALIFYLSTWWDLNLNLSNTVYNHEMNVSVIPSQLEQ